MNVIIFRFDRIGDFLVSSLLINNLKNKIGKTYFTVVCSDKNFSYIKNSKLVDKAILLPSNFFKRILFYFNFLGNKYDVAIVLDGKKKSIISSIFLNCSNKILVTNKSFFKILFKFFFNKIFYILPDDSKIFELKEVSKYLNYDFDDKNTKYTNRHNLVNKNITDLIKKIDNYNILHFDEKWIFNDYIKSYVNIEPSKNDLLEFVKNLTMKSGIDLFITTGQCENHLINVLKSNFVQVDRNIHKLKINNRYLYIVDNINIFNLEYIISNSSLIVTCEGTPSHLANMYSKNLIAIIDKSEDRIFRNWTDHFTNYKLLNRCNFREISRKILEAL